MATRWTFHRSRTSSFPVATVVDRLGVAVLADYRLEFFGQGDGFSRAEQDPTGRRRPDFRLAAVPDHEFHMAVGREFDCFDAQR
jgi:hypothetical protein